MTVSEQTKEISMSAANAAKLESFYGRPADSLAPVQVAMFYAAGAVFMRPRNRSTNHDR